MDNSSKDNNKPAISRRGFVSAGVVSAALVAVGGSEILFADKAGRVYLRPPGYKTESDFLSACNRCGRCIEACEEGIIQPLSLSVDVLGTRTPVIDFSLGYCTYCNKCMEVCPTGALDFDRPASEHLGVAKIIKDACITWYGEHCKKCKSVCSEKGCITKINRHPVINENLCTGCGICMDICPVPNWDDFGINPSVELGIYVVPRESAAAHKSGPITSNEYLEGKDKCFKGGI